MISPQEAVILELKTTKPFGAYEMPHYFCMTVQVGCFTAPGDHFSSTCMINSGFSSFVNLMMTQGGVEWLPDLPGDKVSVYGRKPYEFKDSPLFVQELNNLLCN